MTTVLKLTEMLLAEGRTLDLRTSWLLTTHVTLEITTDHFTLSSRESSEVTTELMKLLGE